MSFYHNTGMNDLVGGGGVVFSGAELCWPSVLPTHQLASLLQSCACLTTVFEL